MPKLNRLSPPYHHSPFTAFESAFYSSAVGKTDLSLQYWFGEYIRELEEQGREGTRISYQTTLNSFHNFKTKLRLTDINKEFLQRYEAYMKKLGKSPSTIGIYLRQLRAIINRAIDKGVLKQEQYPFKNFEIPGFPQYQKSFKR